MNSATKTLPLLRRIRRGEWVDRMITVAQAAIGIFALLGLLGWLTLRPFLLLTFIFAQPLLGIGITLFIAAAFFFERAMTFEIFEGGEIVYRQGSPARAIYLVKSGMVDALIRSKDGREEVIATFNPGQYLGFAALPPATPHKYTARARIACELVRIRPGDFISIFSELPEVKSQIPVLQREIDQAIEKATTGSLQPPR